MPFQKIEAKPYRLNTIQAILLHTCNETGELIHMDIVFWVTILVVGIAGIWDLTFSRIPNWLTFPAMVFAVGYHVLTSSVAGLLLSISGLLVGFFIFLSFYILGGMGAGDVKLMAAIGAFIGPRDVFYAALFTAIAGGIYAAILCIVKKNNRRSFLRFVTMIKGFLRTGCFMRMPDAGNEKATPLKYGVAIGFGTLAVLIPRMI